jgi:hypothetical protein
MVDIVDRLQALSEMLEQSMKPDSEFGKWVPTASEKMQGELAQFSQALQQEMGSLTKSSTAGQYSPPAQVEFITAIRNVKQNPDFLRRLFEEQRYANIKALYEKNIAWLEQLNRQFNTATKGTSPNAGRPLPTPPTQATVIPLGVPDRPSTSSPDLPPPPSSMGRPPLPPTPSPDLPPPQFGAPPPPPSPSVKPTDPVDPIPMGSEPKPARKPMLDPALRQGYRDVTSLDPFLKESKKPQDPILVSAPPTTPGENASKPKRTGFGGFLDRVKSVAQTGATMAVGAATGVFDLFKRLLFGDFFDKDKTTAPTKQESPPISKPEFKPVEYQWTEQEKERLKEIKLFISALDGAAVDINNDIKKKPRGGDDVGKIQAIIDNLVKESLTSTPNSTTVTNVERVMAQIPETFKDTPTWKDKIQGKLESLIGKLKAIDNPGGEPRTPGVVSAYSASTSELGKRKEPEKGDIAPEQPNPKKHSP